MLQFLETEMLSRKELRTILKYKDLIIEIKRMWNVEATVIPVIIGATGTNSKSLRPLAALTPEKTRYPLYRWPGGPRRSGRVRKLSLPPGFDPRTVQPVASRYTD